MHTKRITSLYGHGKKPVYLTSVRGPHKSSDSISLLYLVRDMLKLADNAKEAKKIIYGGKVLVDGKAIKDCSFGVGLMDVISIPEIEKYYRVLCREKLELKEISKEEAGFKLCKITGKRLVRGAKIQISMHDGYNMLSEDPSYRLNDTLVFGIPDKKVLKVMKFENGKKGFVIKGSNAGKVGDISDIRKGTASRESLCRVDNRETLSKYVFVVGEQNSMI